VIQAWLFGVGILFVLAELGIWLKQFILPLPIYILGGAFLAIASNYEKGIIALFRQPEAVAEVVTVENLRTRVNLSNSQAIAPIPNREALKDNSKDALLPEAIENSNSLD
jgi:hypothetical protein